MLRLTPLVLLIGCSSSYGKGDTGSMMSTGVADTGLYTDTTATDTTYAPPVWWSVSGELVQVDGALDPAASLVRLALLSEDLTEQCVAEGPPEVEALTPPDPGLFSWWELRLSGTCADQPTSLRMGFGPYDPLLDPAVDAAGLPAATLGGLYTTSDGALWVFGVSGTAGQFSGQDPPLTAGPLPDGAWRFQALYTLPL